MNILEELENPQYSEEFNEWCEELPQVDTPTGHRITLSNYCGGDEDWLKMKPFIWLAWKTQKNKMVDPELFFYRSDVPSTPELFPSEEE